ncbi:MAG: pitrilysin family protein [bacterium]
MQTGLEGTHRLHDTARFARCRLSNGITVWLQKTDIMVDHEGYLSMFFKNVGSANDPRGLDGLAHFLEHMLFRKSFTHDSETALKDFVVSNGGEINARTNAEFTEYYVMLDTAHFSEALQSLHSLVCEPVFDLQDVVLESKIILQEFLKSKARSSFLVGEHIRRFLLAKNDPFNHAVLGNPATIKRISQQDIYDFYHKYYHTGNANIICGGSFARIPNVLEELEMAFGMMCKGKTCEPVFYAGSAIKSGNHRFLDKRYPNENLSIQYCLPVLTYEERIPLMLLLESLAGRTGAPFDTEVRIMRGLTYHIDAEVITNHFESLIDVECELDSNNFELVNEIFLEKLATLSEECILKYVKSIQQERLIKFQHPISACKSVVSEIVYFGKSISCREHERLIDETDITDIFAWKNELQSTRQRVLELRIK